MLYNYSWLTKYVYIDGDNGENSQTTTHFRFFFFVIFRQRFRVGRIVGSLYIAESHTHTMYIMSI